MIIIVHSMIGDDAIRGSLGRDDYSYYFVRRFFGEALAGFAEVVEVSDPVLEVDPIFDKAVADGETCLFLSFAPPQKTVLGLRCPVVPVFAWEFSTIPTEMWDNDIRNDWRAVFAVCAGAIALSSYTVRIVKEVMGNDFPIVAIPTPVFERFEGVGTSRRGYRDGERAVLRIAGTVLDTDLVEAYRSAPVWPRDNRVPLLTPGPLPELQVEADDAPVATGIATVAVVPEEALPPPRIGLHRRIQITRHFGLEWYRLAVRDLLPRPVRAANALAGRTMHQTYRALRPRPPVIQAGVLPQAVLEAPSADESAPAAPVVSSAAPPVPAPVPVLQVALDGVVFMSIFSPRDGRKNWTDLVTAFCWAMRDVPDATLVLKIVANDHGYEERLRQLLGEMAPLRCRVVVLHGFLETPDYRALIEAAGFYVNASHCEGLCLPMLEFMSAGTPAIAPGHTAFEDYVSPENSFVIGSGIENTVWPADSRDLFRTTRYRIDWHELMLAYRAAYRVAKQEPERYAAMSCSARKTMSAFCGTKPVTGALRRFLSERAGVGLEHTA